jgi:hypothetical protein
MRPSRLEFAFHLRDDSDMIDTTMLKETQLIRIAPVIGTCSPPLGGAPEGGRRQTRVAARNPLAMFLGAMLLASQAQGGTFVVSDTNDTTALTSLRGAIVRANRLGGVQTIVLTRTNYQLTIGPTNIDDVQTGDRTGDLDIRGSVIIISKSAGWVTISASGLGDRVFHVLPRAQLTLRNIAITGGASAGDGGGIWNEGTLIMRECAILGNCAVGFDMGGGNGGGIWNGNVALLENCVILNNSGGSPYWDSGGSGGGIYNGGTMLLNNCALSGNSGGCAGWPVDTFSGMHPIGLPYAGSSGGSGGGIYNSGSLVVHYCVINGNTAGAGGIGGSGGDGGLGGSGGGIYNSGRVSLTTCTVSGNYAGTGGTGDVGIGVGEIVGTGGAGGSGGGVFGAGHSSTALRNTLVILNHAGAGGPGGVPSDGSTAGPSGSSGSGPDTFGDISRK